MPSGDVSLHRSLLFSALLFLLPVAAGAQSAATPSRIVETVNEANVVTLRGNTHPLARPQFDQGAAPANLPMPRILLVLQRSVAQEAALEQLLDAQQDKNSPSYHQWLTPDQFGQQFGPSDQDLQTIQLWLGLHGFQIGGVTRGRTVIEFSGTAGQVQQAFHTEIHKYVVNGQEHWANASDPQIPAALAPVIVGINSLHNFAKKPLYRLAGKPLPQRASAEGIGGQTTILDQSLCDGPCYFVSPYDFATIYNVLPLWNQTPAINGTGQAIAIINRSNINIQDVRDFRTLFGLPANDPQVVLSGSDPGIVQGDETEADLDVEWSGAVATGATVNLVIAQSTSSTDGVDLAAIYAVDNNIAPVMSESFGECELFLGSAGNTFASFIRQQAAAQGITYMTSTGDQGSAVCDASDNPPPYPATYGLTVNGLASTPYGVAVGGTDFLNYGATYDLSQPSPYWSAANDSQHQASALGYVPETTWNDSCTNNVWVFLKVGSTPEQACNNSGLQNDVLVAGGSGGKSACIIPIGTDQATCTAGYPKPSWQSAPGVPADGARDLPDVSLFASNGFMNSSYILCEADQQTGPCSLSSPLSTFVGVGGTSASAPAFAGIMALVNQSTGSSGQGNANYVLYQLASSSKQTSLSCGATSGPAAACIFYDVTYGTIEMPCEAGSLDCTVTNSGDVYGVLSGYSAAKGYDQATGLGSVNVANLVQNWIRPANSSSTTLTLNGGNPVNITHGQSVPFDITVTPSAAPGLVALMGSPSGSGFVALGSFTLANGSASGNTSALAGGNSYAVKAHYPGNGTYGPSDSAPVTVTVAPEPSKTLITVPVFSPNTGAETGNTPSSISYGAPVGVRVDVGNAQAKVSFPSQTVCAMFLCPTGNVTVNDSYNGGAAAPLSGTGLFTLNPQGYAENDGIQLPGGTHQISANYPGDNSYNASSGSYALTVTPAAMQLSGPYGFYTLPVIIGTTVNISDGATATNRFTGAAPTGTMTFYDGTAPLAGTVTYGATAGQADYGNASITGTIATTFSTPGTHQLNVVYSGDANYAGVTGSPVSIGAVYSTSATLTPNPSNINLGQSVTVTATVTGASKTPSMTGTFLFSTSPTPVTGVSGVDANGNQTLSASVTVALQGSQSVDVTYSGDGNYSNAVAFTFVTVNLPDFSMSTGTPNLTITAGQSQSTVLTLTALNNIPNSVALSCASAVLGSTCMFNPASPIAISGGGAASTTVMISTLPPSSSPTTTQVGFRPIRFWSIPPVTRWMLAAAEVLAALFVLILAGPRRRLSARFGFASLLCLALGCGAGGTGTTGGGTGGGGGGGGNSPVATSLSLATSSVKVAAGTTVTFTATLSSAVSSGALPSGEVSFIDSGTVIGVSGFTGNTSTWSGSFQSVGTHVISAGFSGDPHYQASQTHGSINQVVTGLATVIVTANSTSVSHSTQINVTIQ